MNDRVNTIKWEIFHMCSITVEGREGIVSFLRKFDT